MRPDFEDLSAVATLIVGPNQLHRMAALATTLQCLLLCGGSVEHGSSLTPGCELFPRMDPEASSHGGWHVPGPGQSVPSLNSVSEFQNGVRTQKRSHAVAREVLL